MTDLRHFLRRVRSALRHIDNGLFLGYPPCCVLRFALESPKAGSAFNRGFMGWVPCGVFHQVPYAEIVAGRQNMGTSFEVQAIDYCTCTWGCSSCLPVSERHPERARVNRVYSLRELCEELDLPMPENAS